MFTTSQIFVAVGLAVLTVAIFQGLLTPADRRRPAPKPKTLDD